MSDEKVELAGEVLDILTDLWPKPAAATVQAETHQWIRLRRVLLRVVDYLVDDNEPTAKDSVDLSETVVLPPAIPGWAPRSFRAQTNLERSPYREDPAGGGLG